VGAWGLFFSALAHVWFLSTPTPGPSAAAARPLTLGPGSNGDFGPSDAWAGRYNDGVFYRINGKTGYIITTVALPNKVSPLDGTTMVAPRPYGATIDQFGILWAPNIAGHYLFYFDTSDPNNPAKQGMVAAPTALGHTGDGFYGVAVDGYRDGANTLVQQIWMAQWQGGGGAFRYRPKRTTNFADLANGTWAFVSFPSLSASGRGIAVDNRTPANVWVGMDATPGGVGRIDANVADGASTSAAVFRPGAFAGNQTLGVGVANDLDIWAVNRDDHSLTHYTVAAGTADLTPADKVLLSDNPRIADGLRPYPYTYSDFTGFGLRNFTNPRGFYQWRQVGCGDGIAGRTRWLKVVWDGETPVGTSIEVKVRSADDPVTLDAAAFSAPYVMSPAELQLPPALMPNPSGFLDVQFNLITNTKDASPKLKGFQIMFECVNITG
jgi:hypothetical protein